MKYEVAGDPVSDLRWTRKTTKKIAAELSALGIRVSRKTVAKLLRTVAEIISHSWMDATCSSTSAGKRIF